MFRSLSDGASSYQRSLSGCESVTRPRSLEADNVLNPDSTPRPEKGDACQDVAWPLAVGGDRLVCGCDLTLLKNSFSMQTNLAVLTKCCCGAFLWQAYRILFN